MAISKARDILGNGLEQWFPKWVGPPPWRRWKDLGGGEAKGGKRGAVEDDRLALGAVKK